MNNYETSNIYLERDFTIIMERNRKKKTLILLLRYIENTPGKFKFPS